MVEFLEVMKQWQRMCKELRKCIVCPVNDYTNGSGYACGISKSMSADNLADFERTIMTWAAEHPEPRWPSWNEAWRQLFPGGS